MDAMKVLLFVAFAIALFHSSHSQSLQCKSRKCGVGQTCKVFTFRCSRPPCASREVCLRSTVTTNARPPVRDPGRTTGSSSIFSIPMDCSRLKCADGEYCKMKGRTCSSLPCNPIPVCEKIVEKDGQCPAISVSRVPTGDCNSDCSRDDQCTGTQKCCMEGCKKMCMLPQDVPRLSAKSGICPNFPDVTLPNCTAQCADDSACGATEKCCRYGCSMRCVEQLNSTADESEKPLSCLPEFPPLIDNQCLINCRVDGDCPGIDKCCLSGCSMSCKGPGGIHAPRPVRDGYCPTAIPNEPCKRNCSEDSRCPGDQKCCVLGSCHKICVDPESPPPGSVKPGSCPAPPRSVLTSPCAERCRFDNTCSGEQKCCQYGCVSMCMDPNVHVAQTEGRSTNPTTDAPVEQDANCPSIPNITGTRCRDQCRDNSDCSHQMKCCMFNCGKKCIPVVSPRGLDCGRDECNSDASCPSAQVCRSDGCRKTCQTPVQQIDNKPGSCPTSPSSFRINRCTDSCRTDKDCFGSQKCCTFGGCKRCLPSTGSSGRAIPRPSQCPDMPATSNLTSCEPTCSRSSCTGGKICCPYGCSTRCLDPVVNAPILKAGFCPATATGRRSFTCFRACSSDSDCSGNTKCCGSGCNARCVTPRDTPPRMSRQGFCPANKINSPTTNCVSKCSDDFACLDNEKCCFNGCRRECVPSVRSVASRKPGYCPHQSPPRIPDFRTFRANDCGHFCNSDFSCPGDLKCCKVGCKTSCISKQSQPAPTLKEGYCPATTQSSGPCERSCNSDSNCQGNQKCCFEGSCTQRCVNPDNTLPAPRQGMCPNVPPLPVGQCNSAIDFCNYDHACPEPLKCCFDGCSKRCINPESSVMSTKEGFCPGFSLNSSSVCRVDCVSDDTCPGDEKCCSVGCAVRCVVPNITPPRDKAGFCPFIPTSLSNSCQNSCQLDDSCPGIMKCCQNGCSRKCYNPVAMPPAVSKAGYCPATVGNPTCDKPCTSDGSCSGNQKCCHLGSCGMSCVDPESTPPNVKFGFCPYVNPNISTMCLQTCSSDFSCAGDTKCCSFGQCSMRCMSPEIEPHAERKPGDCPSSAGARGQPSSIQCLSDYACSGQEKCCRIGSTVKCAAPAQNSPIKPGGCPEIISLSPICTRRCFRDSQCADDKKCCASGCSSFCSTPTFNDAPRRNPGHCPYVEPHVLLACTVNCTADADCGDDQKCCEYGCGMRCLNSQPFPPTTQKDGNCPRPPMLNPLYNVPGGRLWFITKDIPSRDTFGYRNCRNDGQCPGTLKCCSSSVGGTECITPV